MNLPHCRPFLVTPKGAEVSALHNCLSAALEQSDAACLLVSAQDDMTKTGEILKELTPIAQSKDVAVLMECGDDLENSVALMQSADADGIHMNGNLTGYKAARKLVGSDQIVGFECLDDRHTAMEVAEAGADYVAFEATDTISETGELLLSWWTTMFEVPCVCISPCEEPEIVALCHAGVDFLRPSDKMWQNPQEAIIQLKTANLAMMETNE